LESKKDSLSCARRPTTTRELKEYKFEDRFEYARDFIHLYKLRHSAESATKVKNNELVSYERSNPSSSYTVLKGRRASQDEFN
jgi:hypothetical protein